MGRKKVIAEAMDEAIAEVQAEAAAGVVVEDFGGCRLCDTALFVPGGKAGLCDDCAADVAEGTLVDPMAPAIDDETPDGDSGPADDRACRGCQAELSAEHDGELCADCQDAAAQGPDQMGDAAPAADAATQVEQDMRQPSLFPPSPFDYERAFDAIASARRLVTARREEWESAKNRASAAKRLHDEAERELEDRIAKFERQQWEQAESVKRHERALVAQAQREQADQAPAEQAAEGDGTTPAVVPEAATHTDSTEDSTMSDETQEATTQDAPAAVETSAETGENTLDDADDEVGDADDEDDD